MKEWTPVALYIVLTGNIMLLQRLASLAAVTINHRHDLSI